MDPPRIVSCVVLTVIYDRNLVCMRSYNGTRNADFVVGVGRTGFFARPPSHTCQCKLTTDQTLQTLIKTLIQAVTQIDALLSIIHLLGEPVFR
jgi:hypothetical protein